MFSRKALYSNAEHTAAGVGDIKPILNDDGTITDPVHGGKVYPELQPDRFAELAGLPTAEDLRAQRAGWAASCVTVQSKGVGDVTSDARGSGARFNADKPPVELIPVWIIAACAGIGLGDTNPLGNHSSRKSAGVYEAREILDALGDWQRAEVSAIEMLQRFESEWTTDAARVFDYGRKKYAEWNWAKGMAWSIPLACAVRHLLAILRGEENDPESGLPHRGHVACNLVMLAQYEQTYREGDDRPVRWLTKNEAA